MSNSHLLILYTALTLGAVCVVGIFSELRRRRFSPSHPEDRVFRCAKCGNVYTDDPDMDRSRCTQCGKLNTPVEF